MNILCPMDALADSFISCINILAFVTHNLHSTREMEHNVILLGGKPSVYMQMCYCYNNTEHNRSSKMSQVQLMSDKHGEQAGCV